MEWNFEAGVPIYSQIVEIIRRGIISGQYPPGSKMPSVRELAMEAGVNPNTMHRALSELERDELLRTERTNGKFVTEDEGVLRKLRKKMTRQMIATLIENLHQLGLSDEQIEEELRAYVMKEREEETS